MARERQTLSSLQFPEWREDAQKRKNGGAGILRLLIEGILFAALAIATAYVKYMKKDITA